MPYSTPPLGPRPIRIGSLFSGYGGLDLAVEHATGGETAWFSELNDPVARVFTHHWPEAPNLGDITTINWNQVTPVDVLCGGFPCQDVSTVGKQAGLAPGTRSGLWSHMAEAIDVLQPRQVVIENVRGLLSARAIRPQAQGATDDNRNPATPSPATLGDLESATWSLGDDAARPLRALGAPHHRFRIFILATRQGAVSDSVGVGLLPRRRDPGPGESQTRNDRAIAPDHRLRPTRTAWLTEQEGRLGDSVVADRRAVQRWGRYADAITRWEHITGRAAPSPAIVTDDAEPRPAPAFVEWLMGLPAGWTTDSVHGLTSSGRLSALGNGVLPIQAVYALRTFCSSIE